VPLSAKQNYMDNRYFRVNGYGDDLLLSTLTLALQQLELTFRDFPKGWVHDPFKGMVLLETTMDIEDESVRMFPPEVKSAALLFPYIKEYLGSQAASDIDWENCPGYASLEEQEVESYLGWMVYCEEWGRVSGWQESVLAVCPSYAWSGK
jgi:hypothetical protein